MPAPRVSVICIFYNAARFIREALDSVLAQDFTDYELILADDGSSDESTAIARDFVARFPDKVRYVEHPGHANRGMSATRNLGLEHAAGEFVAFIDSDDRWRPGKLRAQVAILDAEPRAGIVCGTVNYWSSWEGGEDRLVPTGGTCDGLSCPPETSLNLYPLGRAAAPCPSDALVRRAVIERVGGFEAHFTGPRQIYEDAGFFSKAWLETCVWFSGETWLDYRLHDESCVSTVHRDGHYSQVRRYFLNWFADYLEGRDAPGKERVLAAVRRAQWALDHLQLAHIERRLRRLAG